MFSQLKTVLVNSYIGAIGLGYLLAQTILHVVGIISAPLAVWVSQKEWAGYRAATGYTSHSFPLRDALPELVRAVGLFVLWYLLVKWLYFTPPKSEPAPASQLTS